MNKKLIAFIVASFICLAGFAQGFTVNNYKVTVTLNADGYFDVVEDYDIEFSQYKHGIYRDILLKYDLVTADGSQEKRQIEVSRIKVPGHMFEATGKFGRKISGKANIKIGDPNKTIVGPVNYTIQYRVKNAFLHDQDYVQFYWNLKPTDWNASFKNMQFKVNLPDGIGISEQQVNVYSGNVGFTKESEEFKIAVRNNTIIGEAIPEFQSNYGQAVTILLNLPAGSIAEIKPIWPFWNKYGWTLLVGGLFVGFYLLWRKYGEDDKVPTAISYFPPKGIDPAMAGFLIDDKQDTSDLISLIPYWGAKGYISITEIDKEGWFAKDDTEIEKLKDLPDNVPTYEREFFFGLFKNGADRVMVSSLKNEFYTTMSTCKGLLKEEAQIYYDPKSKKVQLKVTVGLVLLALALVPTALYIWGVLAAVAVFASCLILLAMNFFMIKKNTAGNAVFAELKGFRQFIKTAEERKLETLIKDQPNYFETTMGYALTFGALSVWASKFDNLNIPPPSWYRGQVGMHHSMSSFSKSFSSTMASASQTMISSPSSSGSGGGGGSSGGGFGGGGGGSW